jgi:hypothetical protein
LNAKLLLKLNKQLGKIDELESTQQKIKQEADRDETEFNFGTRKNSLSYRKRNQKVFGKSMMIISGGRS